MKTNINEVGRCARQLSARPLFDLASTSACCAKAGISAALYVSALKAVATAALVGRPWPAWTKSMAFWLGSPQGRVGGPCSDTRVHFQACRYLLWGLCRIDFDRPRGRTFSYRRRRSDCGNYKHSPNYRKRYAIVACSVSSQANGCFL